MWEKISIFALGTLKKHAEMEYILSILIFILVGMALYWFLPISMLVMGVIYFFGYMECDTLKQKILWTLGCSVFLLGSNLVYIFYFS